MLWTQFVGAFSDGSVVVRSDPSVAAMRDEPDGYRREPTYFIRYSSSDGHPDTLAAVLGPEKYLYHEGRTWDLEDRLFERAVVGVVIGNTLVCGNTADFNLRRISASGTELPVLAFERPARRVSEDEVAQERQRLTEDLKERQERMPGGKSGILAAGMSVELDRLSKKAAYETRPAFRSMRAGSDGELWVEDYPSPTSREVRWILVVGVNPTGWLEVGVDETVLAFGHGLLVERVKDQLDIETVIIKRVTMPKPK